MRYLPLTEGDRKAMLAKIGAPSVESLYGDVPAKRCCIAPIADTDSTNSSRTQHFGWRQRSRRRFNPELPQRREAYRHVPAVVDPARRVPHFLHAPTSRKFWTGTLQYLFEFQTQVALLTGMDVANASMYDGATATVRAAMMANRVTRRKKTVLSGGLHPITAR